MAILAPQLIALSATGIAIATSSTRPITPQLLRLLGFRVDGLASPIASDGS